MQKCMRALLHAGHTPSARIACETTARRCDDHLSRPPFVASGRVSALARFSPRLLSMRDGSALRPTQQSRTLCSGIKAEFNTAEGPEHVVIVGGGSLGSLFAGRLGAIKSLRDRVWLLTSWEEQAKAVEENQGLIVQEEGQVGNKCLMGQVQVVREPSQVSREIYKLQNAGLRGKANVVILAVKQPSIRKAAEQAATILADVHGGVCVTLLNGLGHIETVRNTFRNNDVQATLVHGVFTGGAHIRDVGMVQHVGKGQLSLAVVGGKPDPLTCQLLEEVGNALHASGIDTSFVTHVLPLAWDKLCVNVAINALTALLGVSNGRLLESDDCKDIMRDAVREAHAVACRVLSRELGETEAATCALVKDGWQASADKALRVAEMTAGNRSSMLCDIETRRPTEVEAIYGSVVGEGDREGIATPTCRMLLRLVRARTLLSHDRKQTRDAEPEQVSDIGFGSDGMPKPIPLSS